MLGAIRQHQRQERDAPEAAWRAQERARQHEEEQQAQKRQQEQQQQIRQRSLAKLGASMRDALRSRSRSRAGSAESSTSSRRLSMPARLARWGADGAASDDGSPTPRRSSVGGSSPLRWSRRLSTFAQKRMSSEEGKKHNATAAALSAHARAKVEAKSAAVLFLERPIWRRADCEAMCRQMCLNNGLEELADDLPDEVVAWFDVFDADHSEDLDEAQFTAWHKRLKEWVKDRVTLERAGVGVDDEEVELQGADDATALAVSRRCTCFTALVILDSQLHNSTLQALLQTAKHRLVALDLSGSKGFSDVGLKSVAVWNANELQSLRVVACPVTDDALKVVAKHCPEVRTLAVTSSSRITDASLGLFHDECAIERVAPPVPSPPPAPKKLASSPSSLKSVKIEEVRAVEAPEVWVDTSTKGGCGGCVVL